MDRGTTAVKDSRSVLEVLHNQLWDLKIEHEREVQARIRGFVVSEFGEPDDAPWACWFPVVASTFLYMGDDGQTSAHLFDYVIAAACSITGRTLPPGCPAFPDEKPERCWCNWDDMGTPPPIQRAGQPVISPRARVWERPEYDVWQWDVMYDLLTRLKHLGDLSMLELHPVPGIDPEIVYPPERNGHPVFDHAISVESRPPMGLVVASLLTREIAYFYAGELPCGAIGDWIFEVLTGKPPGPRSRPPYWLEPALEARFKALEPAAMLTFCERSLQHFADYLEGIVTCDG